MKIIVIDRDETSSQTIRAALRGLGHAAETETVKSNALERLEKEPFETVFFDPAPLTNARPLVLGIRRAVRRAYPYIVLMSDEMTREDALRSGANDVLPKPAQESAMATVAENAERLTALIARIGDESEDFPSAGGVIAKSAFNQLFLSAIDRADRYAERSFLLFISIRNYKDIVALHGAYAAEYATARLSQYLVRIRRQSDIIAQTGKNEYCLMLQRPLYETEPMDAAARFAQALERLEDVCATPDVRVDVGLSLIDVPVGQLHAEHVVTYKRD